MILVILVILMILVIFSDFGDFGCFGDFDCYKGEEKCRPYVRHRFLELLLLLLLFLTATKVKRNVAPMYGTVF